MMRNIKFGLVFTLVVLSLAIIMGFSNSDEKNPWRIIEQLTEKINSLKSERTIHSEKLGFFIYAERFNST